MSLHEITFSHNWNGKLYCNCFSTIRLRNDKKYQVNGAYKIKLKNYDHETALICFIQHFTNIYAIPEPVWLLDTGYNKQESVEMMQKMYKNIVGDWNTQQFSFILLRRTSLDISQQEKPQIITYKAKPSKAA